MALSLAQLESAVADPVQVAKGALKSQSTESKNVVADKGPSYPFYFPYLDVDEKFPKTELFELIDPGSRAYHEKPHPQPQGLWHQFLSRCIVYNSRSSLRRVWMNLLFLLLRGRSSYSATKTSRSSVSNARLIAKYANFTFRPTNWAYYVLKALRSHPAATSGNVKGFPEFHVVYRDAKNDPFREYAGANQASHAVASPGTTSFFILDQPEVGGGDTLFLSQVEAYNRPSPEFQKRLEGLQALHSAVPQAEEPVETERPVVRVHPVTALYVNLGFIKSIVGFGQEESEIRAHYEPETVVVWDNWVTAHSAVSDFSTTFRRHSVRLTPQAEIPTEKV